MDSWWRNNLLISTISIYIRFLFFFLLNSQSGRFCFTTQLWSEVYVVLLMNVSGNGWTQTAVHFHSLGIVLLCPEVIHTQQPPAQLPISFLIQIPAVCRESYWPTDLFLSRLGLKTRPWKRRNPVFFYHLKPSVDLRQKESAGKNKLVTRLFIFYGLKLKIELSSSKMLV